MTDTEFTSLRDALRDAPTLPTVDGEPLVPAEEPRPRRKALQDEIDRLHRTIEEQRRQLQERHAALDHAGDEKVEEFKKRVGKKMAALAREHDWCGVAKTGLSDLDIEWPDGKYEVTVSATLTFRGTYVGGSANPTDVNGDMATDDDDGTYVIGLDSDWSDVVCYGIEIGETTATPVDD